MDDDDELEMLQKELMAVQQERSNPLSQRTVAEIMVKLYKNNFPFYPTTDGNQYVTPERLDKEIITLVKERGKIVIGLLPQILNINLDAIETRINCVLKNSGLVRHNNFLMSQQEINSVIVSVKQRLQVEGKIDLQEIAVSNEFNMIFTRKIVEENITDLNAELFDNQLITNQFRLIQKARVLGFLNAVSRPLHVDAIQKNANLQERNLENLIEELIKQNRLAGRCQNGYFFPIKFAKNQKKIINNFFQNNGYLEFSFLQKNFVTNRQQEWLSKNLQSKHVCFEGVCFSDEKLQNYRIQLSSLLKGEGVIQTSSIIPFELEDKSMGKFLSDYCKLSNFLFSSGYCYSQQWLDRCALEFRYKVIHSIFFKKPNDGKKKGKKTKEAMIDISEKQLVETLFDGGLAEYSVLENLAPFLLPILNSKLEELKIKCEKELAQSKGIINTGFLQYRRAKTIPKTQESLTRCLNTIQKQKKKTGKWEDPDFGPSEEDKIGQYSLIYIDGVLYKNWPPLQDLKWIAVPGQDLSKALKDTKKSQYMKKSFLPQILTILEYNIRVIGKKLESPILSSTLEKKEAPFVFQFFTEENSKKFVIVDDQLPVLNGELFGCDGLTGLVEKAYAKLRYCYKAVLSVGIQQLIFEMTGRQVRKIIADHNDPKKVAEILIQELEKGFIVLFMAQGEMEKRIFRGQQETGFICCKPYSVHAKEGKFHLFPEPNQGVNILQETEAVELFRQAYIF